MRWPPGARGTDGAHEGVELANEPRARVPGRGRRRCGPRARRAGAPPAARPLWLANGSKSTSAERRPAPQVGSASCSGGGGRWSSISRSKRSRSSSPGSTTEHVAGRPAYDAVRAEDAPQARHVGVKRLHGAFGGGSSPHSAGDQAVARDDFVAGQQQHRPAQARCFGPPSGSSDPSRRTSSGPRMANSMRASKTPLQGDFHIAATGGSDRRRHERDPVSRP